MNINLSNLDFAVEAMEPIDPKIKPHTPKFKGTEEIKWDDVDTTLGGFLTAYYKRTGKKEPDKAFTQFSECPAEIRKWMSDHSLLGDPEAKEFKRGVVLPVVDPATGKLNSKGIHMAKIFASRIKGITEDVLKATKELLNALQKDNFKKEEPSVESIDVAISEEGLLTKLRDAWKKYKENQQRLDAESKEIDMLRYFLGYMDNTIFPKLTQDNKGRLQKEPIVKIMNSMDPDHKMANVWSMDDIKDWFYDFKDLCSMFLALKESDFKEVKDEYGDIESTPLKPDKEKKILDHKFRTAKNIKDFIGGKFTTKRRNMTTAQSGINSFSKWLEVAKSFDAAYDVEVELSDIDREERWKLFSYIDSSHLLGGLDVYDYIYERFAHFSIEDNIGHNPLDQVKIINN